LSYNTSRGTPPKKKKARSWQPSSVSQPLIGNELDVCRPAPSQRRDEHRQPVTPAPDGGEVGLHLAPWFGLEANQRLGLRRWSQRREVSLQDLQPPA
jgi:hypothetical protein